MEMFICYTKSTSGHLLHQLSKVMIIITHYQSKLATNNTHLIEIKNQIEHNMNSTSKNLHTSLIKEIGLGF
jgi:hypothetical protein